MIAWTQDPRTPRLGIGAGQGLACAQAPNKTPTIRQMVRGQAHSLRSEPEATTKIVGGPRCFSIDIRAQSIPPASAHKSCEGKTPIMLALYESLRHAFQDAAESQPYRITVTPQFCP